MHIGALGNLGAPRGPLVVDVRDTRTGVVVEVLLPVEPVAVHVAEGVASRHVHGGVEAGVHLAVGEAAIVVVILQLSPHPTRPLGAVALRSILNPGGAVLFGLGVGARADPVPPGGPGMCAGSADLTALRLSGNRRVDTGKLWAVLWAVGSKTVAVAVRRGVLVGCIAGVPTVLARKGAVDGRAIALAEGITEGVVSALRQDRHLMAVARVAALRAVAAEVTAILQGILITL